MKLYKVREIQIFFKRNTAVRCLILLSAIDEILPGRLQKMDDFLDEMNARAVLSGLVDQTEKNSWCIQPDQLSERR